MITNLGNHTTALPVVKAVDEDINNLKNIKRTFKQQKPPANHGRLNFFGDKQFYFPKSKKAAGSVPNTSPSFTAILRETVLRPFSIAHRFCTWIPSFSAKVTCDQLRKSLFATIISPGVVSKDLNHSDSSKGTAASSSIITFFLLQSSFQDKRYKV